MNIAFLSYYSGISYRGAETFVHELANHLIDLKMNIQVYQHGSKTTGAKYQIGFLDSLHSLPQFDPIPDIIFPTNGRWQSLLTKLWCLHHHKHLIIAGQSGLGLDDRLNLYCFPKYYLALSDYQRTWAQKINPFVKVAKISNGVDLNRFHPRVKPLKIDLPHPIILNVAALIPLKRQDLLIRAVANTSASLLIVGRGGEQDRLQKLGDQLLGNRFKILSFPYDQMPQVYTACDLFSFPTVPWESFGIAMLEAMASGLPVIASDDPIRQEIIGTAGLLVNPENTQQFSECIRLAIKKKWGQVPLIQVKKYAWPKIAQIYYRLFSSL